MNPGGISMWVGLTRTIGRNLLRPLVFAADHDLALVAIAHLNKGGADAMARVMGSLARRDRALVGTLKAAERLC